jgi:hypothetical protein
MTASCLLTDHCSSMATIKPACLWKAFRDQASGRKVAKTSPEAFVAIAARICPNDVRLTPEQAIPGGMSLEDYSLMPEMIAAIREALPDGLGLPLWPGGHQVGLPTSERLGFIRVYA